MTLRGSARRSIPYLVAIMSGFLLAYLIVAFFIFPAHLVTSDTKVPNVVGQTYDAAAAQLQKAGFVPQRGEQRFTAGAASGQVLGQTPLPDAVEPHGTRIVLDVSQGQRTATVPQIIGMTRQQAELALQNAGLEAGDVTQRESPSPRGPGALVVARGRTENAAALRGLVRREQWSRAARGAGCHRTDVLVGGAASDAGWISRCARAGWIPSRSARRKAR